MSSIVKREWYLQSFFEPVISFRKVLFALRKALFALLLIIGLGPSLGYGTLHIFIPILIHILHHPHNICSRILFLLLLAFLSKLPNPISTLSSLKASWLQDLESFLTITIVTPLFLRMNLHSAGLISPANFLIAKIKFCPLYPRSLISTDHFSNTTSTSSLVHCAPTPSRLKMILAKNDCT